MSAASSSLVRVAVEGRLTRLTLDRPPLHILDFPMMEALAAAVAKVARDPGVAAMVLTSTGDKALSAGVDIKIHTPEQAPAMLERFHEIVRAIGSLPCVTVAGV